MSHMHSPLRLTTVFIAGVLAGAVAGVLFAPSKGRKTRKRISRQAKTITNELVQKLGTEAKLMQEKIGDLMVSTIENFEDLHHEPEKTD